MVDYTDKLMINLHLLLLLRVYVLILRTVLCLVSGDKCDKSDDKIYLYNALFCGIETSRV